jgi:transposase-like protein
MKGTVNDAAKKTERRKYDAESKQQLLNLIANGQSVGEVSHTFGVGENLLHRWRRQGKAVSKTQPVFPMEMEELRTGLEQAETERDVSKKALAIFSRQT